MKEMKTDDEIMDQITVSPRPKPLKPWTRVPIRERPPKVGGKKLFFYLKIFEMHFFPFTLRVYLGFAYFTEIEIFLLKVL